MVKVKVCGITNMQDATWAVSLGADYIGFNFYSKSPRKVSMKMAGDVISRIPPLCEPVGIFVNEEDIGVIVQAIEKTGIKLVQLHGKEQPEYCQQVKERVQDKGTKIIKAFRIKGPRSLANLQRYTDIVDYFLLDAYVPGVEGGTGEVFNWDVALTARKYNKPIFLAGGLTPENVAEAARTAQPFGVDSASGIERLPRRKDYDKLKDFIVNAKSVKI